MTTPGSVSMNDVQLRAYEAISNAAQEMAGFYAGKDDELAAAIENAVLTIQWDTVDA